MKDEVDAKAEKVSGSSLDLNHNLSLNLYEGSH